MTLNTIQTVLDASHSDDEPALSFSEGLPAKAPTRMGQMASIRDDDEKLILEPFRYLSTLPSTGVRNVMITSLNLWYSISDSSLKTIQEIIELLYTSCLMIDDIQDNSSLRRGLPAAHIIYGVAQTINSANYIMIKAIQLGGALKHESLKELLAGLEQLHVGQGHDLHWTFNREPPTEAEYFQMIERKTGGQFCVISNLLRSESGTNQDLTMTPFMLLLGKYYQIRDDYLNLCSEEYTSQNGFCEDFDEGKFSLPIIHALSQSMPANTELLTLLRDHKPGTAMSLELKIFALKLIEESGGFEYTREVLHGLFLDLEVLLNDLEVRAGEKNLILRAILQKLRV